MIKINNSRQIDYECREHVFLLQFEGDINDVCKKFGLNDYYAPINNMAVTGLFGILDALMDLRLTNNEIRDFYIQGHWNPMMILIHLLKVLLILYMECQKMRLNSNMEDILLMRQ